ncbi:right-handed parallel beta-helix repeat-containing protein [Bdellovibrio sp. HCB290]|uniref:right-handed parallel beta-helix repeat-containing protein n=1 Tax=Bdellovibrio sp. HCB290 TaxID=3394356 RepID=UPI0039B4AED3
MKKRSTYLIGLTLLLLSAQAMAVNIYVSPAGTDTGNCQSNAQPCKTLSYGIGVSNNGDAINLESGIYSEQGPISISKSISIIGRYSGVDAKLRYAGGYSESDIQVTHGFFVTASGVIFDGIQLSNAVVFGIKLDDAVSGTIVRNSIFKNSQTPLGIMNTGETPMTITQNVFINSSSSAIMAYNAGNISVSNVLISENLFIDHPVVAVDLEGAGPIAVISNVTIDNNSFENCRLCIIYKNTGSSTATNNTFQNPPNPDRNMIGIWIIGSNDGLTITQNEFTGGAYGAYLNQMSGYPNNNIKISRNSFGNQAEGGIGSTDAPVPRSAYASCNWWGDASGPKYSLNPDGTGAAIVGDVEEGDYTPWLATSNLNGLCGDEPPPTPPESGTSKDFEGIWKSGKKCLVISSDLVTANSYKKIGPLKVKDQNGTLMAFGTSSEPSGDYTSGVITYRGLNPRYQEVKLTNKNRLKVDEYYSFGSRNPFNHFDTETYHRVRKCEWRPRILPPRPRPPHPRPQPKPTPSSTDAQQLTAN